MFSSSTVLPASLPDALSDPRQLERFSKIELVVVDLDGTLMSDVKDLPDGDSWARRSKLVKSLKARSVPFTIATGRALAGAQGAISALVSRKNLPVILYNGSAVLTADRILISHQRLSNTATRQLMQTVVDCGGDGLLYWLHAGFDGRLTGEWATYVGAGTPPATEFNGMAISQVQDLPPNASCVAALIWSGDPLIQAEVRTRVTALDDISVTASGSKYVEVRPPGSSKGTALRDLLNHLDLSSEEVMAIGDNDNDVELLRAVGTSVCVCNASVLAQQASSFTTKYPSSSGVIEALQLVALARRLFPKKTGNGNGTRQQEP